MNTQRVIALLGRKDEPTDAVEEYCRYLGVALTAHDVQLEIERFPWEQIGWGKALAQLEKSASAWRGKWILVQYTALSWSARGFPTRFLGVLRVLRSAGARVAVVYHDVGPFPGARLVDRLRRALQLRTMRIACALADTAIFTIALENISWLQGQPTNAIFIPVGPNLPIPATESSAAANVNPAIGVFSITGGEAGARETKVILAAVRHASEKLGNLRLSIFGRHAEIREAELRQGLRSCSVELSVEGVLDPDQVVKKLSSCDLLLFVRGAISSRRGSAIAGIACGLPILAFSGPETAAPVTEAGVVLVPEHQPEQLHAALVRLLSDPVLRAELASRSRLAYLAHFSWPAIAARFAAFLNAR